MKQKIYNNSLVVFQILFFQTRMQTSKKQAQQYLKNKVNPIFQQILVDLIKSKPRNILNFCKVWFQRKVQSKQQSLKNLPSDSQTQSDSQQQVLSLQAIEHKKTRANWYRQRPAICGQVYGTHNKIDHTQIAQIVKKPSVNNRILFRLKSLFLFKDFDYEDTSKLISAMTEETYDVGMVIIKQGDQGNEIFIVDQGQLHCYRRVDQEDIYIKTITEGEMFGEVSMLYNSKRTAYIRVKTKAICFKLDRKTFNAVVRQRNIRNRNIVSEIMKKIDIFRQLQPQQKFQIQDLIQQIPVHLNEYIIREGKVNNKLYMIEYGKLVGLKKQKNGHEKIISHFNDGDYFGINNLVNREPSGFSVMALTTSKLYCLDSQAIERVIGPIYKILRRNVEVYEKYHSKNDKSDSICLKNKPLH